MDAKVADLLRSKGFILIPSESGDVEDAKGYFHGQFFVLKCGDCDTEYVFSKDVLQALIILLGALNEE